MTAHDYQTIQTKLREFIGQLSHTALKKALNSNPQNTIDKLFKTPLHQKASDNAVIHHMSSANLLARLREIPLWNILPLDLESLLRNTTTNSIVLQALATMITNEITLRLFLKDVTRIQRLVHPYTLFHPKHGPTNKQKTNSLSQDKLKLTHLQSKEQAILKQELSLMRKALQGYEDQLTSYRNALTESLQEEQVSDFNTQFSNALRDPKQYALSEKAIHKLAKDFSSLGLEHSHPQSSKDMARLSQMLKEDQDIGVKALAPLFKTRADMMIALRSVLLIGNTINANATKKENNALPSLARTLSSTNKHGQPKKAGELSFLNTLVSLKQKAITRLHEVNLVIDQSLNHIQHVDSTIKTLLDSKTITQQAIRQVTHTANAFLQEKSWESLPALKAHVSKPEKLEPDYGTATKFSLFADPNSNSERATWSHQSSESSEYTTGIPHPVSTNGQAPEWTTRESIDINNATSAVANNVCHTLAQMDKHTVQMPSDTPLPGLVTRQWPRGG